MPIVGQIARAALRPLKEGAKEMGFDPGVFYHGTIKNFEAFDPNFIGTGVDAAAKVKVPGFFFTPSRSVARRHGHKVQEVHLRLGRSKTVDFGGKPYNTVEMAEAVKQAKDEGYNSVVFRNVLDGMDDPFDHRGPTPQIVIWEPARIRSTDAAFDPKQINSSRLLASVAGLGIVALMSDEALAGATTEGGIPYAQAAPPPKPSLALPIEVGPNPSPSLIDRFSAAFQTENATVDLLTRPERPPAEREFNPLDHLQPGEEPIAHELADARSMAELNQLRDRRAKRARLREQVGTGASGLIIGLTAAVLDPIPLLAGSGALRLGRALLTSGRVLPGVGAAAADIGTQEAILLESQPERSAALAAASMALGAAAGGVLGAVVGRRAVEDLATMGQVAAGRQGNEAVGAAPVRPLRPEDTELAPGFGLPQAFGSFGRLFSSPSLRILNSRLASAREAVLRLTDVGVLTKGVLRGTPMPQSADVAARSQLFSAEADLLKGFKLAFREHRRMGGQMTEAEFRRAVGQAMRRGDTHLDPVVTQAAKAVRQLIGRVQQRAGALFPEEYKVEGLPRDYAVNVLRARSNEFIDRVAQKLVADGIDPTDAEDLARSLWGTLTNQSRAGRLTSVSNVKGGKEALDGLPDDLVEDFLEDDALLVMGRWLRTAIADTELGRVFGNVADAQKGFDDAVAKIKDEAFELAKAATEPREVKAINDEAEEVIDLLTAVFNRVRGIDAPNRDPALDNFRRMGRIARNITSTQLMGSVALSNLGDIGAAVIKEGTVKLLGTVVADLGRGLRGMKLSRRQAQQFGTALEMALHSRRSAITGASEMRIEELGQAATLGERVEAKVQRGTDLYFKLTLLSPLIDALKSASSAVISTRILEAAEKVAAGGALGRHERTALAAAGLDDDMLRRFAAQSAHWERVGDGRFKVITGGVDAWTDAEAVRAFGNALLRDTDTAVITPFAGDLPVLFDKEWGRVIAQFKRFSAASTVRLLAVSAQRLRAGEVRVLGGIGTAVGIGAGITALKDLAIGGEVRERGTGEWVNDAVDRSGVASIVFELNSILDVVPGYGPITVALGETSRFAARTPFERLLGPVAGQVEGTSNVMRRLLGNAGGSPFTEAELRSAKYLIPGQNLVGVGLLLNKAVEGAADTLDLPAKEPRR